MPFQQSRRAELLHLYGVESLTEFRQRFGWSCYAQWWAARIGIRLVRLEVERFLILDCHKIKPAPASADSYQLRQIDARDCHAYMGAGYDLDADFLEDSQRDHDICIGAFQGDQLAAYGWFTTSPYDLMLPQNMAYTFKAFTRPEHRGVGLQASIKHYARQLLQIDGVDQFLTIVNWINWSSQRACFRAGYRSLGQTIQFNIGNRDFVVASSAIARSGITIGHQHEVHSPARAAVNC